MSELGHEQTMPAFPALVRSTLQSGRQSGFPEGQVWAKSGRAILFWRTARNSHAQTVSMIGMSHFPIVGPIASLARFSVLLSPLVVPSVVKFLDLGLLCLWHRLDQQRERFAEA
jgi:hypothetical protein